MKLRVVQIWGFLMTVLGWIFVACTMAMEGWKITSIGGMGGSSIIKVAWYWSSLWRSCFTDSTAVSNCYDYPVLWSVEGHIQIVRGLLMAALTLGMLGFVLSLLGMECTFLGGKDKSKYKKIYAGGCCHITSGLLSICGYAVYAEYVSVEYFNPNFDGLKYDLGTPLFLGWVGSAFHMTGGFFYLWSACKPLCGAEEMIIKIQPLPDPEQNKSTTALSTVSEFTSKTKVSSVSELSSRSERSNVSGLSSGSERTSRSGRTAKSGWSSKTGRTSRSAGSRSGSESGSGSGSESGLSSRSSISTLAESRSSSSGGSSKSSRTVSPLGHRVAQLGGQGGSSVVVTAWFWSDLWRDCYEDSTGLVNCVDLGGTLKSYIQAVRGLLMFGLCFGLIGTVLASFGMECTHIGGDERTNNRLLVTASALHLLGCASDIAGYCLYLNRVLAAFLHSKADPSKLSYEIGPPLYLGLVGSCLIFLGCAVHSATVCIVRRPERHHRIPFKSKNQEGKEAFRRKEHIYGGSRKSNKSQTLSAYKMASIVIV